MRKLLLITLFATVSNILFCQDYNIKFQVKEETENKLNNTWDYQYHKFFSSAPCYITFDGKTLKMSTGNLEYFKVEIISTKNIEKTETIYGNKVITEEQLILGTNGPNCVEYYIIRKEHLQQGGYIYTLYRPFIFDGKFSSYKIYRSGKIL